METSSPPTSRPQSRPRTKVAANDLRPVAIWSGINLLIFVLCLFLQLIDGTQISKDSFVMRFGIAPLVSIAIVVIKALLNNEISLLKTAVFWDRAVVTSRDKRQAGSSLSDLNNLFLGDNLLVSPVRGGYSNAAAVLCLLIYSILGILAQRIIDPQDSFLPSPGSASVDWPDATTNASCGLIRDNNLDRCGSTWHWYWFVSNFHNQFLVASGKLDAPVRDATAAPVRLSQLMRLMPEGTFTTDVTTVAKLAKFVEDSINAAIVGMNTAPGVKASDPTTAVLQRVPAQIEQPAFTLRIRKPELIAVGILILLVDLISIACITAMMRRVGRWRQRLLSRCMLDQLVHLNPAYGDKYDAPDADLSAVDRD
ncbi:hypothetical protein HK102_007744, partial [Quaeritorhiza haematococci]